jgi:hypothetical protein
MRLPCGISGAADGATGIGKASAEDSQVQVLPAGPAPNFLKGTVMAVDCSSPLSAILSVASGRKTLKMQVPDSSHIVVWGADGRAE